MFFVCMNFREWAPVEFKSLNNYSFQFSIISMFSSEIFIDYFKQNRPDCQDYVVLDFSSQERFNQNRSQSRFQVDEQLSSEDEIDLLTL